MLRPTMLATPRGCQQEPLGAQKAAVAPEKGSQANLFITVTLINQHSLLHVHILGAYVESGTALGL